MAQQQTLSEITAQEQAKRAKAARYEELQGHKASLEQAIERLNASVPELRQAVAAIKALGEHAEALPDWILTVGRGQRLGVAVGPALPGGFILSTVIRDQVTFNTPLVVKKLDDALGLLVQTRKRLGEVVSELKEF